MEVGTINESKRTFCDHLSQDNEPNIERYEQILPKVMDGSKVDPVMVFLATLVLANNMEPRKILPHFLYEILDFSKNTEDQYRDGLTVMLPPFVKKLISRKVGISMNEFDKILDTLIHQGFMRALCDGIYHFNPVYFGFRRWEKNKHFRITYDFCKKGEGECRIVSYFCQ